MISVINNKEAKMAGDYAIVKHNNVPVAIIVQAFEQVSNSYDLYFTTYNIEYCMKEVEGNPTIKVGKTHGTWYGYNLYKKIDTRNTAHCKLQLVEESNITVEDYSSITHPLKAYLEYRWVNPTTKETETHTVYLSDEKDEDKLELILDTSLGYGSKTVKELLNKAYPTIYEYFEKHENKETDQTVSYIITWNNNFLVNDFARNTFIWYAPDGKFLSYSSEGEFDHLCNKNLKIRWSFDIKYLFKEMNETMDEIAKKEEENQRIISGRRPRTGERRKFSESSEV